jgi:hypothetical protein
MEQLYWVMNLRSFDNDPSTTYGEDLFNRGTFVSDLQEEYVAAELFQLRLKVHDA